MDKEQRNSKEDKKQESDVNQMKQFSIDENNPQFPATQLIHKSSSAPQKQNEEKAQSCVMEKNISKAFNSMHIQYYLWSNFKVIEPLFENPCQKLEITNKDIFNFSPDHIISVLMEFISSNQMKLEYFILAIYVLGSSIVLYKNFGEVMEKIYQHALQILADQDKINEIKNQKQKLGIFINILNDILKPFIKEKLLNSEQMNMVKFITKIQNLDQSIRGIQQQNIYVQQFTDKSFLSLLQQTFQIRNLQKELQNLHQTPEETKKLEKKANVIKNEFWNIEYAISQFQQEFKKCAEKTIQQIKGEFDEEYKKTLDTIFDLFKQQPNSSLENSTLQIEHVKNQPCCQLNYKENEQLISENDTLEYKNFQMPLNQNTVVYKNKEQDGTLFLVLCTNICSFLNQNGGVILIGVDDKNLQVKGISMKSKDRDEFDRLIYTEVANNFYPSINTNRSNDEIKVQYCQILDQNNTKINDRFIIKIIIKQRPKLDRLYGFWDQDNLVYTLRCASSNHLLDPKEINKTIRQRAIKKDHKRYDYCPSFDYKLQEYHSTQPKYQDEGKVMIFRKKKENVQMLNNDLTNLINFIWQSNNFKPQHKFQLSREIMLYFNSQQELEKFKRDLQQKIQQDYEFYLVVSSQEIKITDIPKDISSDSIKQKLIGRTNFEKDDSKIKISFDLAQNTFRSYSQLLQFQQEKKLSFNCRFKKEQIITLQKVPQSQICIINELDRSNEERKSQSSQPQQPTHEKEDFPAKHEIESEEKKNDSSFKEQNEFIIQQSSHRKQKFYCVCFQNIYFVDKDKIKKFQSEISTIMKSLNIQQKCQKDLYSLMCIKFQLQKEAEKFLEACLDENMQKQLSEYFYNFRLSVGYFDGKISYNQNNSEITNYFEKKHPVEYESHQRKDNCIIIHFQNIDDSIAECNKFKPLFKDEIQLVLTKKIN